MVLISVRNLPSFFESACNMGDNSDKTEEHKCRFYGKLETEKQNTGRNHRDKKYIDWDLYTKTIEAVKSRKYEKCPSGDAHFKDWAQQFCVCHNQNGDEVLMSNPQKLRQKRKKQEQQRKKLKEQRKLETSDAESSRPGKKRVADLSLPVLKYEDYFAEIQRCHQQAGHNMENTWRQVSSRWYFVTKRTVQLFCETCKDCRTAPKPQKRSTSSTTTTTTEPPQKRRHYSSSLSPTSSVQSVSSVFDEPSQSIETPSPAFQEISNWDLTEVNDIPSDLQNVELHPITEYSPNYTPLSSASADQRVGDIVDQDPASVCISYLHNTDPPTEKTSTDSRREAFIMSSEGSPSPDCQKFVSSSQPDVSQAPLVRVPLTRSLSVPFNNLPLNTNQSPSNTSRTSYGHRFHRSFPPIQITQLGKDYPDLTPTTVNTISDSAFSAVPSIISVQQEPPFTAVHSAASSVCVDTFSDVIDELPDQLFLPQQATPGMQYEQSPLCQSQLSLQQISRVHQVTKETPKPLLTVPDYQATGPVASFSQLQTSVSPSESAMKQITSDIDLGCDDGTLIQYPTQQQAERSFLADPLDYPGRQLVSSVTSAGISLERSEMSQDKINTDSRAEEKSLVAFRGNLAVRLYEDEGQITPLSASLQDEVHSDLICSRDISLQFQGSVNPAASQILSAAERNNVQIALYCDSLDGDIAFPGNMSSPQEADIDTGSIQQWTDTVPSTPSQSGRQTLDPSQHIRWFGEIQAALTADEDGDIPLHLAVVHEHLPLVQKFISLMKIARRSVDRFNKDKQTPLHLAVKLNFIPGVKALLAAGADVNFVDKTGCTSLHLAVKHQLPECLKLLVDESKLQADFNTRNFEGLTPLHTAVELKNMELMAYILDNRGDINMMDGKSGRTPLFHAAENNQEAVVEFLLKRGANPDVLNYAGSTAMMAAQARNYNIVTKMLSRASDWNDEDRSGSSSPASEIGVFVPDVVNTKWKHSALALRNAVTLNTTGTIGGSPSASSLEVSLASQSRDKSKSLESGTKTSGTATPADDVDIKSSSSSEQISQTKVISKAPETGVSAMISRPSNMTSNYRPSQANEKESSKTKSNSRSKKTPQSGDSVHNSELNIWANQRAINDLAKKSPQIAMQLQKLYEAKQAALRSSHGEDKQSQNTAKESEQDTTVSSKSQAPASSRSSPQGSQIPQQQGSSNSPVGSHSPGLSPSPGSSQAAGPSPSTVTTQQNMLIPSTVTSRAEAGVPRVVSAPSQVIGKVSHVVERLPQQPERIISTGMVVEHPEYGLVFRPFGPGQIQRLNQPGSVSGTAPPGDGKLRDPPGQDKNRECSQQDKIKPTEGNDRAGMNVTKQPELIAEPPVSTKNVTESEVKKSVPGFIGNIPTVKDTVSSYPVTEKLLNSKPKSMNIPKSRPVDVAGKVHDTAPKLETGTTLVKSIANSAIAAKLRQRVLNSPQVDSAAKALAHASVSTVTTAKSSGAVMTAPERVPKLPQFGNRSPTIPSNLEPSQTPSNVSKTLKGTSKIIAQQLTKPIETETPVPDLTKVKMEKSKKQDKRKKKETNGNSLDVKKKSTFLQDSKKDENDGVSEPMDTSTT